MIKEHGHLGLPAPTRYELLENHFGEEFTNAQLEPRHLSNAYYKCGYKAATDCHDLLDQLLAAKKNNLNGAKPGPQGRKAKEGTCHEAGASNRGPYSSDALSWTCCEHNFHSIAHSSGQCGTSLLRHVTVALSTVHFSNVGFHPCGNVEQHVIGLSNPFATKNAVAIHNHCGNRLLCPWGRLLCPWRCRCKCSHTF